jgi:hypothetical protein
MARRKSGGLRNLLRGLPSYEVGGYADRGYESESPADTGPSLSDVGIDSSRPGSFSDFGPATSDGRTSSTDYGGGRDYGRSTDVSAGTSRGSSRSSDNDVGTTRGGSFSDFGPATDDGRTSNTDYGGMSDYGRDTGYGFADPGGGFMGYGASDFPSDFIGPHNSQMGGGSSGENYANSWGADSARYGGSQASPDLHFGESDPGFADRSYPGWGRSPMVGDDDRGTYMTEPGTLVGREPHSFPLDPRDFPSQIPTIALAANASWDAPERELDGVLTDSRSKGRFGTSGVTSSDVFGFDNVAPGTQAPSGPLGAAQAAFAGQQAPQMPQARGPAPQASLGYEEEAVGPFENSFFKASYPLAVHNVPPPRPTNEGGTPSAFHDNLALQAAMLGENRGKVAKHGDAALSSVGYSLANRAARTHGGYGTSIYDQYVAPAQYSAYKSPEKIGGKKVRDIDGKVVRGLDRNYWSATDLMTRPSALGAMASRIARDIQAGVQPNPIGAGISYRAPSMKNQISPDGRTYVAGHYFGQERRR